MLCYICSQPTPSKFHERCEECRAAHEVVLAFLRRGGGIARSIVEGAIAETEPDRLAKKEAEAAKAHTAEEQREHRHRRSAWKR